MIGKNESGVKMRTIPNAYKELLRIDPNTNLSLKMLRKMVKDGEIPSIKVSSKVLINFDLLLDILSCYNNNATCA